MIKEEKLKELETRKFIENAFRVGGSFTADTPKVLNYVDSSSKQPLMMVADDIVTYD